MKREDKRLTIEDADFCPFCGDRKSLHLAHQHEDMRTGRVVCECGVEGPGVYCGGDFSDTPDWHHHAIERWNRRPVYCRCGLDSTGSSTIEICNDCGFNLKPN